MSHDKKSRKSQGIFQSKTITELTSSQQRPAPAGNTDLKNRGTFAASSGDGDTRPSSLIENDEISAREAPVWPEAKPAPQINPVINHPTDCVPDASETAHPAAPKAVADTGDGAVSIKLVLTDTHPSESGSEPATETGVTAENTDINEEPSAVVATPGDAKDTPEDSSAHSESETDHPAAPEAVSDTGDEPIPTELVQTDAHSAESGLEPAAEPDVTAGNTNINEESSAVAATPGEAKDTPEDSSAQNESETAHPAAPTAQDEARENDPTVPPSNDDAHTNAVAENTADATPGDTKDTPEDSLTPSESETEHPAAPTAMADTGDEPIPTKLVQTDAHPAESGLDPAAEPDEGADKPEKIQESSNPTSGESKDLVSPVQHMDVAQQAQRVGAIFQKLSEEGMSDSKIEGISELNTLRRDFCGLLETKSVKDQAIITSTIWAKVLSPIEMKADTLRVICALIHGDMGNKTKNELPHGEWMNFARENYGPSNVRVLQEDMRFSRIRKIENHCDKGLTWLKKLAPIAENHPFSSADDPIQGVIDYVQSKIDIDMDDYTVLARLAIGDNKVKKAGLALPLPVLHKYYGAKLDIDGNDIKEMVAMKGKGLDPVLHLETTLKNAGNRVFALTAPKTRGKKGAIAGASAIPDINSTFVKTSETITAAIQSGNLTSASVNRTFYETLLKDLVAFGKVVFSAA